VNIANYAYAKDGQTEISLAVNDGVIIITFKDSGVPYNPLEKPDPDTEQSADERQIGGLGIFMVKRIMDSVSYQHDGKHNILTLTKRVE
jgi:anti-sigma regulatory factor (Ser/Thr protein kinase)